MGLHSLLQGHFIFYLQPSDDENAQTISQTVVPCGADSVHAASRICVRAGVSDPQEGFKMFKGAEADYQLTRLPETYL
jgi:hypothetical protein